MNKKIFKALLVLTISLSSFTLLAQGPPPPPSGGHGGSGNVNGGNAPIGGGLFVLLGLGAAYGGRKLYLLNKEEEG